MGVDILKEIGLFERADDETLVELADLGEERSFGEDELVHRVGERADRFYVILDGRVVIIRDAVGNPVRLLARLEGGDWFGEMCLFGEEEWRTSARATEPTRLLVFPRRALLDFLPDHPGLRLAFEIAAARRATQNTAASLESGPQQDPRIALRVPATLTVARVPHQVEILNLSVGGISLSGAPASWSPGDEVVLHLEIDDHRLERSARVIWRNKHGIGFAFDEERPSDHEQEIYQLFHLLTE